MPIIWAWNPYTCYFLSVGPQTYMTSKRFLFRGSMGCFFRLIEQFHTQGEPAYCGLGTVAMVLNALGRAVFFVEPGLVRFAKKQRWLEAVQRLEANPLEQKKGSVFFFQKLMSSGEKGKWNSIQKSIALRYHLILNLVSGIFRDPQAWESLNPWEWYGNSNGKLTITPFNASLPRSKVLIPSEFGKAPGDGFPKRCWIVASHWRSWRPVKRTVKKRGFFWLRFV